MSKNIFIFSSGKSTNQKKRKKGRDNNSSDESMEGKRKCGDLKKKEWEKSVIFASLLHTKSKKGMGKDFEN